jgi:hypothetical protein
MAEKLPEPFVPADVDLRGMEFMPLKGDILFTSTTWLKGSHEGRCAALRLWWHSFAHEVPAASLPDDDQLLAQHAGYGEAHKAWMKIKPQAMRGWVKCSDGRWYHKTVAELALEAWKGRLKNREKVKKWREKQAARNQSGNGNETVTVTVTAPVTSPVTAGVTYRREGEGESQLQGERQLIEEDAAAARATVPPPDIVDKAFAMWTPVAYGLGIADIGFLNPDRREALRSRLAEVGGLDRWQEFLDRVREAEFLREADGRPKHWVGLGKLLQPEHFSKLLEGRYAERREATSSIARHQTGVGAGSIRSAALAGVDAAFDRRSVSDGE